MEIIRIVKRIVLSVLALLVAAAVAFTVANWDTIRLVYKVRTSDPERLAQETEERRIRQETFFQEKELEARLPDQEQMEDLLNGKTSAKEVLRSLGAEEEEPSPAAAESQQPETPSPTAGQTPGSESPPPSEAVSQTAGPSLETPVPKTTPAPTPASAEQEILDKCVKMLSGYEVELMEQLGQLKAEALAEYHALPAKKRTKQALISIGTEGLKKCYALEVVADERVQMMLSNCRRELAAAGLSTSSVDELWTIYVQEKDAIKTKYLEKYL